MFQVLLRQVHLFASKIKFSISRVRKGENWYLVTICVKSKPLHQFLFNTTDMVHEESSEQEIYYVYAVVDRTELPLIGTHLDSELCGFPPLTNYAPNHLVVLGYVA